MKDVYYDERFVLEAVLHKLIFCPFKELTKKKTGTSMKGSRRELTGCSCDSFAFTQTVFMAVRVFSFLLICSPFV